MSGGEGGSIAEVGSPVDLLPLPVDGVRPLGWSSTAIALATLLLALANAHALGSWYDELTPTPATERLAAPVSGWTQATAPLDRPRAAMKDVWDRLRALRFGDEQPGESGRG